ncbi:prolyl-tRNA editing protein [Ktedonobacter sp. SOSP1-52]|uniref:YbaK/EbsC family protein n=1 Tax=Ktedonobacter sp. SOSP1-52 TaxID=2778366 RepID=UPI0019156AF2|nr:YbaK/EbsC family protein [Ktedonobacter sp. SOSP1-52]GHO71786.1 prolyl-tRNA editing protein [Ktedonobacter sp. SOSP1-52]
MTQTLSASAQRVQDILSERGFDCQVLELPNSTRTAQEAADSIGTTVGQIVKSLIFRGKESDQAILVVASGTNRVNEKRLKATVGEGIEKPNADFVRERTGFAIGGVAPIGHTSTLKTFIDADLFQYQEIWAAAGTPNAVFRLTPQDLKEMTGGEIIDVK